MPACVPTRAADTTRTKRVHQPHSPPSAPSRRFRVAGAESRQDWQWAHLARGGTVALTGRSGSRIAVPSLGSATIGASREPAGPSACRCRPWTPWRNHQCERPPSSPPDSRPKAPGAALGPSGQQLADGISAFQRNTAPLVRGELARLAREGQRPSHLFLTCADSRLITSMITSSGPGDLFVVRNVGNLVPLPGAESGDDSVAAAIEYAVDVLKVRFITVCGHSGCGAMQSLLTSDADGAQTPLRRWLRHGLPSLERMSDDERPWARIAGREPADVAEQLCLTNVVQQLDHLREHECVARALVEGSLELHGMYFHVGEAQAYLLTTSESDDVFSRVGAAGDLLHPA